MLTALDPFSTLAQLVGNLFILGNGDIFITGLAGEEMSITMEVIKP